LIVVKNLQLTRTVLLETCTMRRRVVSRNLMDPTMQQNWPPPPQGDIRQRDKIAENLSQAIHEICGSRIPVWVRPIGHLILAGLASKMDLFFVVLHNPDALIVVGDVM